jgi:hypothetical protein
LLEQYTSGIYDVVAPIAFLRALYEYAPHFAAGQQNDAEECLGEILNAAELRGELCGMAAGAAAHGGVVMCELDEAARVSARAAPVDIQGLLVQTLTGDKALGQAPPLLLLRVENIYNVGGEDFYVDARASWPSAPIDLAACMLHADGSSEGRSEALCSTCGAMGRRNMGCVEGTTWPTCNGAVSGSCSCTNRTVAQPTWPRDPVLRKLYNM